MIFSTLTLTHYRLTRLNADLGSMPMCDLTIEFLSTYLDCNFKGDPYIKHRGSLIDIFKWAMTKGIVESNLANKTLAKPPAKRKDNRSL